MKPVVENFSDSEDLVTKGFLRQEFKKEFELFERKMDQKFEKSTSLVLSAVLDELKHMRYENREFYQMREQLYKNDIIQERKLDNHEGRILKLEIA